MTGVAVPSATLGGTGLGLPDAGLPAIVSTGHDEPAAPRERLEFTIRHVIQGAR